MPARSPIHLDGRAGPAVQIIGRDRRHLGRAGVDHARPPLKSTWTPAIRVATDPDESRTSPARSGGPRFHASEGDHLAGGKFPFRELAAFTIFVRPGAEPTVSVTGASGAPRWTRRYAPGRGRWVKLARVHRDRKGSP